MKAVLWLAWREVWEGRRRVVLALGVVTAAVALCVGIEQICRARESAVADEIDQIGPPLRLVPTGVAPSMLARYEVGRARLPPATSERVRQVLGDGLRDLEERLVIEGSVGGVRAPIVGVPDGARAVLEPIRVLTLGEVAVGSELARRVSAVTGSAVSVAGASLRVASILPSLGDVGDLCAFVRRVSLEELTGSPGAVNEIRVFLNPGASSIEAESQLRAASLDATIVRSDRGDVADRETADSLGRYRTIVYAVTGGAVLLCLLIAAHLDASERRIELATLVALGGGGATVLATVVARSVIVGGVGAVLGLLLGTSIASSAEPSTASVLRVWSLAPAAIVAAIALGIAASCPTALIAARRDPVRALQEG